MRKRLQHISEIEAKLMNSETTISRNGYKITSHQSKNPVFFLCDCFEVKIESRTIGIFTSIEDAIRATNTK